MCLNVSRLEIDLFKLNVKMLFVPYVRKNSHKVIAFISFRKQILLINNQLFARKLKQKNKYLFINQKYYSFISYFVK